MFRGKRRLMACFVIALALSVEAKGDIDTPDDLHDTTNSAEYLIVTPEAFYSDIYALAQWRSDNGLDVDITLLSRVEEEFAESTSIDTAIRDLLDFVYHNWAGVPLYVLLVGDVEFVPTPMLNFRPCTDTFECDNWFGCVEVEDYMPEFVIGRFPASSREELNGMIGKTISYEENCLPGNWRKNILLLSDNEDPDGDIFMRASNELADSFIPPDYTVSRVCDSDTAWYRGDRDSVIKQIDEGCLLVHYYGHAHSHQLAHESLFRVKDIDSLDNSIRMPIVLIPTVMQKFAQYDCISERFVTVEGKGAVASWASSTCVSGFTRPSESFLSHFFSGESKILGDIILEAIAGSYSVHAYSMNLMGDPALKIAFDTQGIEEVEVVPRYRSDPLRASRNPFSGNTTISYVVPESGRTSLRVYTLSGRLAKALATGRHEAGDYRIELDMRGFPQGIYFARLVTGNLRATEKLILVE